MKRRKGSSIFLFLIRCEALTPRPAITRSIINLIMHQISQRAPTLTNEWFLVLCDPFDLNCRLDSFLIIILIQLLHIPSHLFEQLELIGMKELRTNCTGWVIDVGHQLNRLSPFFHFTLNFFFLVGFSLLFLLVGVATHFVLFFLSRFGIVFRTFHWSCRKVFCFLVAFDWPLMSRQRPDLFGIAFFTDQTLWFFHSFILAVRWY